MNELIYKQDAIDAIMGEPPDAHYPSWYATILKELPAVDTDLLTFSDNLWKIAYERGKAEGRKKGKDQLDETRLSQGIWTKVCKITDSEGLQHEVIHYGDLKTVIEEVTGWMI